MIQINEGIQISLSNMIRLVGGQMLHKKCK